MKPSVLALAIGLTLALVLKAVQAGPEDHKAEDRCDIATLRAAADAIRRARKPGETTLSAAAKEAAWPHIQKHLPGQDAQGASFPHPDAGNAQSNAVCKPQAWRYLAGLGSDASAKATRDALWASGLEHQIELLIFTHLLFITTDQKAQDLLKASDKVFAAAVKANAISLGESRTVTVDGESFSWTDLNFRESLLPPDGLSYTRLQEHERDLKELIEFKEEGGRARNVPGKTISAYAKVLAEFLDLLRNLPEADPLREQARRIEVGLKTDPKPLFPPVPETLTKADLKVPDLLLEPGNLTIVQAGACAAEIDDASCGSSDMLTVLKSLKQRNKIYMHFRGVWSLYQELQAAVRKDISDGTAKDLYSRISSIRVARLRKELEGKDVAKKVRESLRNPYGGAFGKAELDKLYDAKAQRNEKDWLESDEGLLVAALAGRSQSTEKITIDEKDGKPIVRYHVGSREFVADLKLSSSMEPDLDSLVKGLAKSMREGQSWGTDAQAALAAVKPPPYSGGSSGSYADDDDDQFVLLFGAPVMVPGGGPCGGSGSGQRSGSMAKADGRAPAMRSAERAEALARHNEAAKACATDTACVERVEKEWERKQGERSGSKAA